MRNGSYGFRISDLIYNLNGYGSTDSNHLNKKCMSAHSIGPSPSRWRACSYMPVLTLALVQPWKRRWHGIKTGIALTCPGLVRHRHLHISSSTSRSEVTDRIWTGCRVLEKKLKQWQTETYLGLLWYDAVRHQTRHAAQLSEKTHD